MYNEKVCIEKLILVMKKLISCVVFRIFIGFLCKYNVGILLMIKQGNFLRFKFVFSVEFFSYLFFVEYICLYIDIDSGM